MQPRCFGHHWTTFPFTLDHTVCRCKTRVLFLFAAVSARNCLRFWTKGRQADAGGRWRRLRRRRLRRAGCAVIYTLKKANTFCPRCLSADRFTTCDPTGPERRTLTLSPRRSSIRGVGGRGCTRFPTALMLPQARPATSSARRSSAAGLRDSTFAWQTMCSAPASQLGAPDRADQADPSPADNATSLTASNTAPQSS